MGSPPRISVLMPIRDDACYLSEAVDSILGQTYRDFELLVVDDGSTDATPELLAAYAAADDRVRLLRNESSQGVARSLNLALAHARGTLIARMDSDDVSHPERFARQVALLDTRPEVGLVGSQATFIDERGGPLKARWWLSSAHHDVLAWKLLLANPICHPTVMMRADLLRAAGGYDPAFKAEDMELWSRLAPLTAFTNLPEPLVAKREVTDGFLTRVAGWQPHTVAVSQRYAERILGRPAPEATMALLVDYFYGPRWTSLAAPAELVAASLLLAELFDAMTSQGVLHEGESGPAFPLMSGQVQQLTEAAASHGDRFATPPDTTARRGRGGVRNGK